MMLIWIHWIMIQKLMNSAVQTSSLDVFGMVDA
ncbi:hypothetical protein S1OALGB6SA_116 [Olavius algarvensis spirochete endosymbiont]|nr:hypothetical protein S1OALGB6SA_116 [Olavius algarvensis spirochete endosymbiont]